jgi:hypothetical protein
MIGGSSVNLAASGVEGATIGGGGAVNYEGTGGYPNSVAADFGTIAGGDANQILSAASGSTIAGGQRNTIQASSDHAAIGGGMDNSIGQNDWEGTIAGGWHNTNDSAYSFIGGGQFNTIWANSAGATIAGGEGNVIGRNCPGGTIAGGQGNSISGSGVNPTRFPTNAFVAGGAGNIAIGNYSFAAGFSATAWDDYSFVWNDGNGDLGASSGPHTVTFYAAGGYYFIDGLGGAQLLPNATSWTTLSDRNAKKNFQPVDTAAVLAKLATIPVQQWNYKWEQDGDVPNLGPMAQDFKAAFYPGRDDKGISTLEFDGVELAAIQGLNQKLNEKDVEIQALKQSVAELKAMVEKLAHK